MKLYFIGCGDYAGNIAETGGETFLGAVALSGQETYTSCRAKCLVNYPEFEFYRKFVNYQSCDCFKVDFGYKIKMRGHGAYSSGYVKNCRKIVNTQLKL